MCWLMGAAPMDGVAGTVLFLFPGREGGRRVVGVSSKPYIEAVNDGLHWEYVDEKQCFGEM